MAFVTERAASGVSSDGSGGIAAPRVGRVVVINDFSVARGGATTLVLLLIRLLKARGMPVTLIAGDEGEAGISEMSADVALGQSRLLDSNPVKAALYGIYNPGAAAALDDWIGKNDTSDTVYHVHVWSQILSPAIFRVLRRVASRTVIHAHDFFHACPNGAFMDYRHKEPCARRPLGPSCILTNCDRRSYAQKLWRVTRQISLKSAMGHRIPWGRIVVLHEKMTPYFEAAGYEKSLVHTVRNPASPFSETRIRAEENGRFCFIGRLEEEKGPQDALAAARLAGVPMDIIGDGPMREELEARYPEAKFHGWRSREEIGALIADSRALVIPSRYPEPFGLVAAEAAASGLPLILTETALLSDEIVRENIGVRCNTQDIGALAKQMRLVADADRAAVRTMSERGFSVAVKIANTEIEWADGLLHVYNDCLAAADRPEPVQAHAQ